jgi:hypothetical protein
MTRKESGRLGGLARAHNLSKRKATTLARKALKARWDRYRANLRTCPHCEGKGVVPLTAA